MHLSDLHPVYAEHIADLKSRAAEDSLWRGETLAVLQKAEGDFESADEALVVLHRMQRLRMVYLAGLQNDAAFHEELDAHRLPSWKDFTAPPVDRAMQESLALKLYNARPGTKDVACISLGDGARVIGPMLVEWAMRDRVPSMVDIMDLGFRALVTRYKDDAGIARLAEDYIRQMDPVNKRIGARPGIPTEAPVKGDPGRAQLYAKLIRPLHDRSLSGEVFFTATAIPTTADAEVDQIPYEDYIRLFFEMCDQPWDRIGAAQKRLIGELDAGKILRFTNDDGTDVRMDIEGFTFCNSLIAKNVPGSEAFSAPRKDSVEGRIVAKGRFSPPDRLGIVEDLVLDFEKGRLVRFSAAKGEDIFRQKMDLDEGARYIGEIGIGTNPHLKRHVASINLVEKIGGSFHVAFGNPYTFTDYMGDPVRVDNGNRSALHWDVTTMLHGRNGNIELDGRLIMENGRFLDPAYAVLNEGWASVPRAERPAYWQDYYERDTTD